MKIAIVMGCVVLVACGGSVDGEPHAEETPALSENSHEKAEKNMATDAAAAPVCGAPLSGSCTTHAGALCAEHRSSGAGRVECEARGGAWSPEPCKLEPGGCVIPTAGGGCVVDVWTGQDMRAACEDSGYRWVAP